ncbi:F-box domain-containing protein [Heracleum sosnowskyi]|uniref:F-box domain-containing protein n=1 Tax=Heracleum sosnowskyi TaxID=360622 RepID=A0AAD8I017_9APIA|nr:F-box domain-containing protein [Heracleum sosnowskyi]
MSKLTKFSSEDIISDLPEIIMAVILTKLPIRDAVRTSVLSSKWKYQWTTMEQLVFEENNLCLPDDKKVAEKKLLDFIMGFLLLHDGPIQKFKLSTSYLKKSTAIDQWLRVISRKNITEIVLDEYGNEWRWKNPRISVPRSIFSFQKLTTLTLSAFTVEPPLEFQGFPCLKYLELDGVSITLEVIENLIPVTICFCPLAWRGDILVKVPVTYDYLKFIEIGCMDYKDMDEVLYVLDLLLQSPNLQELHISSPDLEEEISGIFGYGEEPDPPHYKTADFDIWERKCPADFTFKCLKTVKLSYISTKHDMEFVKFVLGRSPVLEVISII